MKKIIYFSLLLFAFVSCENEVSKSSLQEELIGVWQLSQIEEEDLPTYEVYTIELTQDFSGELKQLVYIDSTNYSEWKTSAQLNWSIEDSIATINGIDKNGNNILLKGTIDDITNDELLFTSCTTIMPEDTIYMETCSFIRNQAKLDNIIGEWISVEHNGIPNTNFRWQFLKNGSYNYEAYIGGTWYKAQTTSYWYAYTNLFVCNFTKTTTKTCNMWDYETYTNTEGTYLHWHVYDPAFPLQDNSYLLKKNE